MPLHVTVIGDGAMATVCAQILASKGDAFRAAGLAGSRPEGIRVRLWGRDPARLAGFNAARENTRYLRGITLHPHVHFEGDAANALEHCALIVCAIPSQFIRPVLGRLMPHIPPAVPVVSVAKGIEIGTLKRPSEVIAELLSPRPIAALSGPNIAGELARRLPATMVVAARTTPRSPVLADHSAAGQVDSETFARWVQELFTTPYLRVYRNDDLLGVEFAGAMKNVIAIAAGILDGMRAGNNAKAALLTRGLVEIARLGVAIGAQPETFAGLAGLGDLVTTCVSPEGRNRSFGERIGRGETPDDILATMPGVVEGMPTCRSVVELARQKSIAVPISEGLHHVLFEGSDPKAELADLMARELKSE